MRTYLYHATFANSGGDMVGFSAYISAPNLAEAMIEGEERIRSDADLNYAGKLDASCCKVRP